MRRDGEGLPLPFAHDIETAVGRGRGIVGMALQFRADFENLLPLERAAGQFIQTVNHPEAHGSTAAKTTTRGDTSGDGTGKRERLARRAVEKRGGGDANHRAGPSTSTARNRHVIIEAKRDPEAVEPGSEIGRARRNSNGDVWHLVIRLVAAMRGLRATQL